MSLYPGSTVLENNQIKDFFNLLHLHNVIIFNVFNYVADLGFSQMLYNVVNIFPTQRKEYHRTFF